MAENKKQLKKALKQWILNLNLPVTVYDDLKKIKINSIEKMINFDMQQFSIKKKYKKIISKGIMQTKYQENIHFIQDNQKNNHIHLIQQNNQKLKYNHTLQNNEMQKMNDKMENYQKNQKIEQQKDLQNNLKDELISDKRQNDIKINEKINICQYKYPFEVDQTDHAETSQEAYQDIIFLLKQIAQDKQISPEQLKIYDPYYCDGGVKKKLEKLGFPSVYNECEDFYQKIKNNTVPQFDVLVTNPPYSGDHFKQLLKFVSSIKTPWFLLVPNYVYNKDYYKEMILKKFQPFYLLPLLRYMYWIPEYLHGQYGTKTSPFVSIWFCHLQFKNQNVQQWMIDHHVSKKKLRLRVAQSVEELPHEYRDVTDAAKKRPNPKARKRLAQQRMQAINQIYGNKQ